MQNIITKYGQDALIKTKKSCPYMTYGHDTKLDQSSKLQQYRKDLGSVFPQEC